MAGDGEDTDQMLCSVQFCGAQKGQIKTWPLVSLAETKKKRKDILEGV